jgi:type IV pilus assembly protein PilW
MKKQRGVTMIELMIAMMLGLGLVAGIGQLFVQSQKSFRLQRNTSDMTDDGAFILEALAKGILLAGFTSDGNTGNYPRNQQDVLGSGLDFNVNSGLDPADTTKCIIDPTDPSGKKRLCEFIKGTDGALIYRFKFGDAANLAVTGNELENFVCTSSLKIGTAPSEVNIGDMISVYIYKENDTDGVPVFYCRAAKEGAGTPNAKPLISDVEKLEFRYGIRDKRETQDPSDDLFYYTKAANVTDWTSVFAIKVFLVMRSAEDNLSRTKGYYYDFDDPSTKITKTDNRVYKLFTKTIFLRATDK